MSKIVFYGLAAGAAFFVAACSGDVTEVTEVKETVGMQVLAEGEDLPKCTPDNEGTMVYLLDSAAAYVCANKEWTSLKGEKGEKGDPGKDGADGKDGTDGKDGKDGVDGENGKDGEDGASFADNYIWDRRDNHIYRTTTIGSQVWMAENLTYANEYEGMNPFERSYCFNNDIGECSRYGRYYSWGAAMGGDYHMVPVNCAWSDSWRCDSGAVNRGICPEGWHLPSMAEFEKLIETVGGADSAAVKLKAVDSWRMYSAASDEYDFTALAAGRSEGEAFNYWGEQANFWTSTEIDTLHVYLEIGKTASLEKVDFRRYMAFSVRCLKD